MHSRDRLKRNSKNKLINTKSKELKGKLAKKPLTHPRERVKRKKETETAKKNLELENLDIETFKNQNIFDVNNSFEKEKKQRGKI